MKKTSIEPQLIPLKDWINVWRNLKEWFKQLKNK